MFLLLSFLLFFDMLSRARDTYMEMQPLTGPLGAGSSEACTFLIPTFQHFQHSIPKGRGLPLPLSTPGPNMGGLNPRRSILSCIAINFLHLQFLDQFALLEPTCPILVSNLAS